MRRTCSRTLYVDRKSGGPGKGWLRVVRDPFEARKVINRGKLAVVMGIEVSKLFDCDLHNDTPSCIEPLMADEESYPRIYNLGGS